MRRHITFALVLAASMTPVFAMAACTSGICNPLSSAIDNIPKFISEFLKVMVQIGLPVVAMFMLYAGFKFASAGGSSDKINEAKENFKWVIIGAVLILGAWVLATLIGNTVTQIVQG